MTDIFKQTDEEFKVEELKRKAKLYAPYVIGVLLLLVGGFFGYKYYSGYKQDKLQDQATIYQSALTELKTSNLSDETISKLQELGEENSSYGMFSNFLIAKKHFSDSDYASAIMVYDNIIINSSYPEFYRSYALYLKLLVENQSSSSMTESQISQLRAAFEDAKYWKPYFGQLYAQALAKTGETKEASMVLNDLLLGNYPESIKKIINLQLETLKY